MTETSTSTSATTGPRTSRQVRLRERPVGYPGPETWDVGTVEVPAPGQGELLVAVSHLSLDPAMRGWLNDVRSYVPPVGIGEVMRAGAVGTVVASRHPDFAVGDTVTGTFGVTEYAVTDGEGVVRVDLGLAPAPTWLGALGMPGMTAYFGLLDVGRVRSGDTVLVSGAAGAVGSVAGQIAKALGCTVVGIAGGPEKCAWLTSIGFDAAIDYKSDNVLRRLREVAPDGVDVFFDNVSGDTLDAGLANLSRGARVVICGAISGYNETSLPPGPRRYMSLLVFRASMTGFVVFDYEDRYAEARERIAGWLADGTVVARETVLPGGVDAFPEALLGLYAGVNTGKLVLEVGGQSPVVSG
ncbi:NADP-dependent oxidoreductase [Mumia zhuanghuii]|uniref:NADP-dependent oxidoreductase n=1 Tax=Mumia zhuanghuii TaxID=2585211 RepID=A0A5C4MMH5_9ACTN|nr:NADP-dependent oxidoreductase [Mumia zhuanghuii]TNC31757.1 NADP-dependent oxidoreductase [Mumia zhuanghuii]TNC46526.1 NADP-dependent oxidoreductase [Mumia zhuanghuii]